MGAVREAAKLPGLRVHDLRHTCATFWLAAGLSVHAAAELLGHVDAALVLRLYGHALPAEVSTAAERLEGWRAAQRVLAERPFQDARRRSAARRGSRGL
jgi:integrase